MGLLRINAILVATTVAFLLFWPLQAKAESCVECHLHRAIAEDFDRAGGEAKTLAGFHGKGAEFGGFHGEELRDEESGVGCRRCHVEGQDKGKLPAREVCIGCHTRSKAALGDEEAVFHAEREHWTMGVVGTGERVSCTECHKGHVKGNPEIKFLTPDVVNVCKKCHEKSFGPR